MLTAVRSKFIPLAVVSAMALAACAGSAEVADTAAATSQDSVPAATSEAVSAAPDTSSDASETESAPESAVETTDAAAPASGIASKTAVVSIDGETWTFDMWTCSAFGPEFLSASGLPIEATPADAELSVSFELPLAGDGDTAEYDNTLALTIGNDTWKAGTLTTSASEQTWGALQWNRDGDVLSGTATLEQSWGEGLETSAPREASFELNCG